MLPSKDPAESVVLEFDFSSELPTVTSAVVYVTVYGNGVDPTPSTMISGSAQITGASVFQRIQGGLDGVSYKVRCEATQGANVIARSDILPVKTI